MKHKRFLILIMMFCVIIFAALNTPRGNFNLFAAIGASPQNVNNVTVPDADFIDTSIDPSFVKSDSSNTYSISVAGKQQSFVINGYYGPNPCTPIGEGGNAYYAISISTQASIYESYLYVPKNIGYKIELYDTKDNLLKTIEGASIAEYKIINSGNTKKTIGWIYGFFKPEDIKSQIGMRRIKMSYQISFALNDPAQIIQSGSPANMPFSLFTSSTQTQAIGLSPIAHGPENLGYPVDIISGNLVENYVDMSLPGGFVITRYYNSGMGYQPGKAFGWMFNFEEFLRFDPDGSVFYRDNTFREYRFAPDPNNSNNYLPAKAGNFLRLAKDSDGNYAVTFKNQTKKVFNTLGLLIKTIDASGNITSYVWEMPINQINAVYDIPQKLLAVMGAPDSFRANRTLTITNPYGRSVYVNFNRFGRVARITDWSGTSTEYTWDDTQGVYLLQYKDTTGNYTTFSYDGSNYNKLVSVNYPNGAQVKNYYLNTSSQTIDHQDLTTGGFINYSYGWQSSPQQMWTTVNVNGKIKTYYYDENGTIAKINFSGPSNNQAVFGFGSDKNKNLLTTVTDPLGRVTTYYNDDRGNTTEIALPNGKSIKFIYDDNNRLTDYCDMAGRHTVYEYDNKNNLTSVKRQDGVRIFFEYDSRGNIVKLTDGNGHSRTYEYGGYGDLAKITDEEGGITKFYHDTLGRIAQIDENGSTYNIKYNNLGLVTQMIDGLNNATNLSYDNNGNLTSTTDAKNNTTTFDHNALNRLIRYTDPENNSASYRYDTNGNMIGITDPMGGNIGFEYNEGNYLSCVRNQNFNRTSYNYDNDGNLIRASNSLASKNTDFTFDDLNRVIQKKSGDNDTDSYEYDNAGNIKKIRSSSGETLYEYDAMDRLTKKTYPSGKEFVREFDNNGNITYEKHVNGDQINYRYDKSDNLISIEKSGTDTLTCKYNQGRELASIEYPNKITEFISYNENKDIVRMKYLSAAGEVIYQVDYTYNELGQVSNKQSFGAGRAKKDISYYYDKAGRLIQTKSNDRIISEYTYDRNGNRLTSKTPRGKVNYSYNSANQLIKENQTSCSYDDAGNLKIIDAGNSSRTYTYDAENNLISATLPGGKNNVESYNYDAYNLRINKTFLNNTTSSCWFNNELTAELDKNGDVSFINYGYGFKNPQGDYYYIIDPQGTVVALVDKNGKVITVYEYDEFGNPISSVNMTTSENPEQLQAGTTQPKSMISRIIDFIKNLFSFNKPKDTSAQSGTSAPQQVVFNKVESPIRFAGYYFDKKTSLYYVKSRYYDPDTGRFTQPDKIGYTGGLNLYAYCANDPVNNTDPKGFISIGSGGYNPLRWPILPKAQEVAQEVIEEGANLGKGQMVTAIENAGGALGRGGRQLTQQELWGLLNEQAKSQGNLAQALIFIPGLGAVPPETARLYIQADRQARNDLQTMRTGLDIASFIPGPAGWFSAGLSFLTGLDFNLGANPNKQPLSFPDFLDPTNFNIARSGAGNGPIGPGTGTGASTGSKLPAATGSALGIIPAGGTTVDNSRIVFTTNRYTQGYSPRTDVCFMYPDGSNVNKFTYGSWQGTDGAICKTNPHLLVFASDYYRRGSGKRNIYLLDLRDWGIGASVRLTFDNNIDEYACAFRPDGAGVAFEKTYPPGPGASTYGIFYVDIKTLKQTNLNNQSVYHNNRTPRFNPANSNQLIYSSQVSSASSPWGIYMINNLDLNTATLVSPSNLYPVISSDGRKIAFTYPSDGYSSSSSMSGVKDIYIMDIGGGNLKQLTFGLTCWHPVFSPDGNWIAFTNIIHLPNGRVPSKIYKVKIDGTSLTNIDPFPGVDCMNYVNDWGNLSTIEDEWE